MKFPLLSLIGTAALMSGCTDGYGPPPPGAVAAAPAYATDVAATTRSCFRSHEIRNHTVADDRTMYIDVGGRRVYRLTMRGGCLAGSTSTDPIITRQHPGSDLICRPIDLDISISRTGFETACIVDSITELAPAEVAALPPKLRP